MLAAVRPGAWVLDLLVLAPLVFAGRLLDPPSLKLAGATWLALLCLSTGVSLFEAWRAHRDAVQLGTAALFVAAGIALAASIARSAPPLAADGLASVDVLSWCLVYVVLSALDVLLLSRVAVADVLAATARVVLRPLAGAAALQLAPLPGMLGLAAALGLYLVFARRRLELASRPPPADDQVGTDTLRLFEICVDAAAALLVIAWVVHALSAETIRSIGSRDLVWTAPLVLWLVWRHRGHVRRGSVPRADGKRFTSSDPVAMLLADRMSLAAMLIWFAALLQVVYRPF
ncbi:MAG: UbiA prenyltransferase family protein [Planctomycetota bacterium]